MTATRPPAMPPIIITCTGSEFDLADPQPHMVRIGHIAHALSHLCRFTGHCSDFYSVAQHSVLVSYLVPEQHAMAGLLHDAAEAYVGDISTPLKALLPDYRAIEARVHAAIFVHFGLDHVLPDSVHQADLAMLAAEKRDLIGGPPWLCLDGVKPGMDTRIEPWGMQTARNMFYRRFKELTLTGAHHA